MTRMEHARHPHLDQLEETPTSLYILIQQVLEVHADHTDPLYFALPSSYAEWEAEERRYREMEDAESDENE